MGGGSDPQCGHGRRGGGRPVRAARTGGGARLDRRRPSTIKAYLPVDDTLGERLAQIDAALQWHGLSPPIRTRTVHEEDWADAWKEHFHVERFGRRIVVRPSWRDFQPGPEDIVIDLDPGMAFGTGQHATTRMCSNCLRSTYGLVIRLLDIGTGSGILASPPSSWAAHCLACDIEPVAVRVRARTPPATVSRTPLTSSRANWPAAWPSGRAAADLAVANITAAAVAAIIPVLVGTLRPGGILIGSGIVADRLNIVLDALAAHGFGVRGARRRRLACGAGGCAAMSPPRVYVPTLPADGHAAVTGDSAHHLARVLRVAVGDVVRLFDGSGREVEAVIATVAREAVTARIAAELPPAPPEWPVHLYQALIRPSRFELLLEKAAELGASSIRPVVTVRRQVRAAEFGCPCRAPAAHPDRGVRTWPPVGPRPCHTGAV
ncbi:MAG: RsmE family RNA methyltransferase [Dehalococcoidia bacterium]